MHIDISANEMLTRHLRGFELDRVNIQNNSVNGIVRYGNHVYFFKILPKQNGEMEFSGYMSLTGYPKPPMASSFIDEDYALFLYNYEDSVDMNVGMLTDAINNGGSIDSLLDVLFKGYSASAYMGSDKCVNDNLFSDRIAPNSRYNKWYDGFKIPLHGSEVDWSDMENAILFVNGVPIGDIGGMMAKAQGEFTKKERLMVVSQGDPIEMNLGIKPILFDFENAGRNDFIGETAVFLWSIFKDGGYFSPKYHPSSYWQHPASFGKIGENGYTDLDITVKTLISTGTADERTAKFILDISFDNLCPDNRIGINREYFTKIVKPIITRFGMSEQEYFNKLSSYIFVRGLLCHNPKRVSQNDLLYCIGLISLIHEQPKIMIGEKYAN